jgi:uncharacterized damage-inducible protein DinB
MPQPSLPAEEVLAWLEKTSTNWRALIEAHPEILALPCDIMGVSTAGELLRHIVAVELRYAERLAGLPATEYASIAHNSAEVLYAAHERAMKLLREQLASDVDWDQRIEFATRILGKLGASRKTILFHEMLHSIRHYAQLATLVRQQGIQPDKQMDFLFMDMDQL